ncbi:hypothetical protein BJX70DRAFT_10703 [Aspergillus crustosus]
MKDLDLFGDRSYDALSMAYQQVERQKQHEELVKTARRGYYDGKAVDNNGPEPVASDDDVPLLKTLGKRKVRADDKDSEQDHGDGLSETSLNPYPGQTQGGQPHLEPSQQEDQLPKVITILKSLQSVGYHQTVDDTMTGMSVPAALLIASSDPGPWAARATPLPISLRATSHSISRQSAKHSSSAAGIPDSPSLHDPRYPQTLLESVTAIAQNMAEMDRIMNARNQYHS